MHRRVSHQRSPMLRNPSEQVKDVIQDLFQVMVQVSTYDAAGRPSKEVLSSEL